MHFSQYTCLSQSDNIYQRLCTSASRLWRFGRRSWLAGLEHRSGKCVDYWAVFISTVAGLTTRLKLGSVSTELRPRLVTLNIDMEKEFVIQELRAALVTMERAIEQNIFSAPGLLEDKSLLQQAIEDPPFKNSG